MWEALAELVAARAWAHVWAGRPWNIAVRGDSQAALGALGKLRSVRSPGINAIARELAHDLSRCPHRIRMREHLPGKENDLAVFCHVVINLVLRAFHLCAWMRWSGQRHP